MNSYRMSHRHRRAQSGIALLTVIFALLLISGIAFGMMYMANIETTINTNFRDLQKAQYGAWSGVDEMRGRLISISAFPITRPSALPATGSSTGILYILNPGKGETVDPSGTNSTGVYPDTELCHEEFPGLSLTDSGNNVPCSSFPPTTSYTTTTSKDPGTGNAYAMPYKWVRVTIKNNVAAGGDKTAPYPVSGSASSSKTTPVCWNGSRQILLPTGAASCEAYVSTNPSDPYLTTVYMITSLGVTSSGARRMVQLETAFSPPFSSNAAVASNDNVTLNGALTVNGYDNCSCSCDCWDGSKTYKMDKNGACNKGDTLKCTNRVSGLTCSSKWGIYAQGTIQNPTGANENIYSESAPGYSGGHTDFPYNPSALVQAYSSMADVVNVTGPPYNWGCDASGCGTQDKAKFGTYPTVDPGSASFDPTNPTASGAVFQITYIPGGSNGSTHLTSSANGAGVLLVQGDLEIQGGLQFYGLIIVTGSVKFSGGGSDPTNIWGAIISGQPVIDYTSLGGSANIHYDSCALANQFKGQPPTVLAARELPY